jgi:hypothetical protein
MVGQSMRVHSRTAIGWCVCAARHGSVPASQLRAPVVGTTAT